MVGVSLIFVPYFFAGSPFINYVMMRVACSMDSIASSIWTPLGIESTCPRVIFTHFYPSFIGWVVRPILMFSPTILRILSLIALIIIVSSWVSYVQNIRSNPSERF